MTPAMWDRRYSKKGYAYGTSPNDFLAEVAPSHLPGGAEVLLLGEGEGRNAVHLAEKGCRCTGVDLSKAGLAKARALARDRGVQVKTVAADLAEYDLGCERWDAIVSIFCHLEPELRRRVHASCVTALRDSGVIIVEALPNCKLFDKSIFY